MEVSPNEEIEKLASQLQCLTEEDDIAALQESYLRLRNAFFRLLFQSKNCQEEHYAWLLMNQDATSVLEKLIHLYNGWLTSGDEKLKLTYRNELKAFKFIISTAILCSP